MALTRVKNGVAYEVLRFPMKVMNVTQGNNEGTHIGTYAIDIAGKDIGIDPTFAPCAMTYLCADSQANGNAVWFQSKSKVLFADGTVDYATFMFIHDNYIADIKQVKNFAQWQEFGDEGTAGVATGNHCHFEVAKGKFVRMYAQNSQGTYHLPNNISADKACVVDGVTIKNGYGMNWKKAAQIQIANESVNVNTSDTKWNQNVILKVGDIVKSASCAIDGVQGDCVICPALGGLVPLSDVSEASDTGDGKCDDYLATTSSRIYLNECKVTALDVKNNLAKVNGYWVKCGPLMAKR